MSKLSRKSKALSGGSSKLTGPAERSAGIYCKLLLLMPLLLIPSSIIAQIQLPRRSDIGRILQDLRKQGDAAQLNNRCEKLLKWSQQLEHEHSDKDLYRIPMNQLQAIAVPLFSDSAFVPYFGKPYEQFSPDERQRYWLETMSKCFTSSQHRSAFTWQRNLLVSSFQARPLPLPLAAGQLVPALAALRLARSNLARMNAEIAALPATAETYRRLIQEKQSALQPLQLVWPSEQRAFNSTLTAASARSAKPALAEELDPLIASAQGYDGLLSLKRAPDAHKELFAAVAQDDRSQYQNRINNKFNAILTGLINEEKAKLAKIGNGASGLKQGAEWYHAFQARYLGEFSGPEVEAVLQAFHGKRRSQLLAVEPELTRMIRLARNEDEIDKLLREYLSLPGDESVPGIDKLVQAAASRKQELHRSEMLGTQATTKSPGRRAGQAPSSPPKAGRTIKPPPTGQSSGALVTQNEFEAYNVPGILGPLYSGELENIPDDAITRNYVFSLLKGINETCPEYANRASLEKLIIIGYAVYFEMKDLREALKSGELYKIPFAGGVGALRGMAIAAAHFIPEGTDDGKMFVINHKCDSPATQQLYDSMVKLAKARIDFPPDIDSVDRFKTKLSKKLQRQIGYVPKPIVPTLTEAVMNACIASAPAGKRWCRCHVWAMIEAKLSEEELKPLTKNFTDEASRRVAEVYPIYRRFVNDCLGVELYKAPLR